MKVEVDIQIQSQYAKEIINSLKVDNINIPQGMQIDMNYNGNYANIKIIMEISSFKDILTLRNTADEILEHANLIINLLENKRIA
ncbi:hypothetical protein D1867_02080 [Acidianus infernus]|uniref:KEOPS complex Pcc1-like subunit n=1 Tax=Acidianus infernus TaxID=12915 RepID=A0A6A9QFR8_ACIIN|nr:KEOPS complex subunit Pcc1 [Acidianus infernus]MCY0873692.1 KEOPS complex subunit Pcc1 [Acidianus infernus]MCY0883546.1 KEOPS complex subunit Pcc1 [Acidianus infernus]MUM64056.1 hypothetical protein [Acidianus infernus]